MTPTERRLALGAAAALILTASAAAQTKPPSLEGDWQGPLSVGQKTLHLALHVTPAPEGLDNASLDVTEQGVQGLPGRVIDQKGAMSEILFLDAGADYTATLSEDGRTLTGKWNQGPVSIPLVMTRQAPAGRPKP